MNAECENGLQYALRSFDKIDYGSCVNLSYRYKLLYPIRPLVQYQLEQLLYPTIHLRQERNHKKAKPSREEEYSELPFKMREYEAMLVELNDKLDKLMTIVRSDLEMLNQ